MNAKLQRRVFQELSRVRPGLLLLVVFLILLSLVNFLVVNQKVVLYLFYVPVVAAAWLLPKRDAVAVAVLAALIVVGYATFVPGKLDGPAARGMLWIELLIWGGILVVTAYLVAVLRRLTQEAMQNLQRAYGGVLSILSKFIQTVDADTEAHSARVSAWSVRIAREMRLEEPLVEEARIAGLLHDVGKVEVSVDLLRKAAALSSEETRQVREHAALGAAMLKPVGGILSRIADAIENHHEQFDGSGYKGLEGEQIPLVARVIAVADAFDALVSDRPYRKGVDVYRAMDTVAASSGTHFDPKVVSALKRIVDREGERGLLESPAAGAVA
jgi:putative nucleotidyltransferase with HDIG domain